MLSQDASLWVLVIVIFLVLMLVLINVTCSNDEVSVPCVQTYDYLVLSVVDISSVDITNTKSYDVIVASDPVSAFRTVRGLDRSYAVAVIHGQLLSQEVIDAIDAERFIITSAAPHISGAVKTSCPITYLTPPLMDLVDFGIDFFNVNRSLVTVVTMRPSAFTGLRTV